MTMPQYNPVIPPETRRVIPPSIVIELKNAGTTTLTVYDIDAKPVTIKVGETKSIRLAETFAQRLREMQERGSPLRVINASVLEQREFEPEPEPEPEPKPRRVRVRMSAPATAAEEAVQSYEARLEDAAAAEYVEQSQRDQQRLGRRNPRPVIYPEITTPEQLLVFMQESESPMPHNELISVAQRILPKGTFFEHQPNRAQIIRALEAAMQRRRR